jgi:hypothetical protein
LVQKSLGSSPSRATKTLNLKKLRVFLFWQDSALSGSFRKKPPKKKFWTFFVTGQKLLNDQFFAPADLPFDYNGTVIRKKAVGF